jgi:hypothetical protein
VIGKRQLKESAADAAADIPDIPAFCAARIPEPCILLWGCPWSRAITVA